MKRDRKEPLWRKENTRALHHRSNNPGGEYRWERNTKAQKEFDETEQTFKPMKTRSDSQYGGRDYTPLFMFLLSRVGKPWEPTLKEAQSRLDKDNPIWWMVHEKRTKEKVWLRLGESAVYSGLFVDDDGILQKIGTPEMLPPLPSCHCCTHSVNGKPNPRKFPGYVPIERSIAGPWQDAVQKVYDQFEELFGQE